MLKGSLLNAVGRLLVVLLCVAVGQAQIPSPPAGLPPLPATTPPIGATNTTVPPLKTSTLRACSSTQDCEAGEFCQDQYVSGTKTSSCQPCWRACLSTCSGTEESGCIKCNCNSGGTCASHAECGRGSFCSAGVTSTCQSCYLCAADTQAGTGGCSAACGHPARGLFPALGLPYSPATEGQTRFVVDGYFEVNDATGSTPLTSDQALADALSKLGLGSVGQQQAALVWKRTDTDKDSKLVATELVAALFVRPPMEVLCPTDPFQVLDVFAGCPCNAVSGAVDASLMSLVQQAVRTQPTGRCPAGFRCSASAYENLRQFSLPSEGRPYVGLCVPCLLGELCTTGTVERSAEGVRTCGSAATVLTNSNDQAKGTSDSLEFCNGFSLCPAGRYCPDPSYSVPCSASNFCPAGSVDQSTCELETAVRDTPFRMMRLPSQPLLASVLQQRKPTTGNVCPAFSATPFQPCDAGYYCSNSGRSDRCPRGHYCPQGSAAPIKCPLLRSCPPGTKQPSLSWGGFILILFMLSIFPLMMIGYHRRVKQHQEKQRKADSLLEFMTTMRFSNPLKKPAPPGDSDGGVAAALSSPRSSRRAAGRAVGCLTEAWQSLVEECKSYSQRVQQWLLAGVYAVSRGWYNIKYGVPAAARTMCGGLHGAMAFPKPHPEHCHFTSNCPTCCRALNLAGLPRADVPLPGSEGAAATQLAGEDVQLFGISRRERIAVEWRSLTLRLPSGKTVLSNVSGIFEHGMLHAILGPSGSGKSTFLATLCNKASYARRSGDVTLFKGPDRRSAVRRELEELQYVMGFVPQDDIVHEDLTVRENLLYAARLRLPNHVSWTEKLAMVRRMVALLGLSHVQHSTVGSVERRGISGGQRKRVNIGCELVARPSLLLLDEPTSGLDSAMSQDLLGLLRRLARTGMNIITTIHQPRFSIFLMFDSVLLLGVGGHTVYLGHSACALQYFERLGFPLPEGENPADFLLDVITGTVPRLKATADASRPAAAAQPARLDTSFIPRTLFKLWRQAVDAGGVDRLPPAELYTASPSAVRDSGGLVRVNTAMVQPLVQVARPRDLQGAFDKFNDIDADHSGKLTEPELQHCWAALQAVLPPADFEEFLRGFRAYCEKDPLTGEVAITRANFMRCVEERLFPRHHHAHDDALATGPLAQNPSAEAPFLKGFREQNAQAESLQSVTAQAISLTARQARSDAKLAYGLVTSRHQHDAAAPRPAAPAPPSYAHHSPFLPPISSRDEEAGHAPHGGPRIGTGGVEEGPDGRASRDTLRGSSALDVEAPTRHAGLGEGVRESAYRKYLSAIKNVVNRWWGGKVRGRRLPSELEQCWVVILRSSAKWANDSETRVLDLGIIALVALALGAVQGYAPTIDAIPANFVMALLGQALLSTASALRTFGSESTIFLQRESPGGLYTLAYWLGRQVWDTADLLWRPAVYMALYHSMTIPNITRRWMYTVLLCVTWYAYGLGYLISVTFARSVAVLVGVAVPLIYGGVINGLSPPLAELRAGNSPLRIFADVSYTRWGVEALTIKEAQGIDRSHVLLTAGVLAKLGYCRLEDRVGRGLPQTVGVANTGAGGQGTTSTTTNNGTALLQYYQDIFGIDGTNSTHAGERACKLAHGDSLDTGGRQLAQMYCYYEQPHQLQHDCAPYFRADLTWLLVIGLVLRVLTLIVLRIKVWRKAQK